MKEGGRIILFLVGGRDVRIRERREEGLASGIGEDFDDLTSDDVIRHFIAVCVNLSFY